jgi:hypothetical protein
MEELDESFPFEIHETNQHEPKELEVCDDEYDPKLDGFGYEWFE